MLTLRAASEVRRMSAIEELEDLPETVDDAEVQLARQVIGTFAGDLDLSAFTDEYQAELRRIIDAKVAGEEVVERETDSPAKVVNLMEALRKSLDQVSAAKKKPAKASGEEDGAGRAPGGRPGTRRPSGRRRPASASAHERASGRAPAPRAQRAYEDRGERRRPASAGARRGPPGRRRPAGAGRADGRGAPSPRRRQVERGHLAGVPHQDAPARQGRHVPGLALDGAEGRPPPRGRPASPAPVRDRRARSAPPDGRRRPEVARGRSGRPSTSTRRWPRRGRRGSTRRDRRRSRPISTELLNLFFMRLVSQTVAAVKRSPSGVSSTSGPRPFP